MPASCKCVNGHGFTSRVVENSPDIDYTELGDDVCPECGTNDFEIEEIYDDWLDD